MQSRPSGRRRKKADGGRCGIEIEAALSPPVFGQTRSIEFALGVILSVKTGQKHHGYHRAPSPPRRQRFSGSPATRVSFMSLGTFSVDRRRAHDGPDVCCCRRPSFGASWEGLTAWAQRFMRPSSTIRASSVILHKWLGQKHRTALQPGAVPRSSLTASADPAPTGSTDADARCG